MAMGLEDPLAGGPAIFAKLTAPLARMLHLHTLPLHAHEIAGAFVMYSLVQRLSPVISTYLCPNIYPRLARRTRISWDVHVVSLVQCLIINSFALWLMHKDRESRHSMDATERVWAYSGAGGLLQSLAAGYFIWDLIMSAAHVDVFGVGMVAHAISALAVYMLGFVSFFFAGSSTQATNDNASQRPFVNFYAPSFILYELSSPFLNIHWFLDKLNLTGSKWQWYNGMLLLGSFFSARLVWGTYASVCVFHDIYQARFLPRMPDPASAAPTNLASAIQAMKAGDALSFARLGAGSSEPAAVPLWLAATYLAANLTLNGLNWFWFARMIETVRKRFRQSPDEALKDARAEEERQAGRKKGETETKANGSSLSLGSVAASAEHVRRRVVAGELRPANTDDEIVVQ